MPPQFRAAAAELGLSPAIVSGPHVFLSGATGSGADGAMPDDPAAQIESAFAKVGAVLDAAGLTFQSVVEMTSYHIGLRAHFDLFNAIRLRHFSE
ncbi:MAG: Rid family hydrolase, partial [Pseudomonadota bacterium]